jgi:hypothetical protein
MLLNILQCTKHSPTQQRFIRYEILMVLRLRKPAIEVNGFKDSWQEEGRMNQKPRADPLHMD